MCTEPVPEQVLGELAHAALGEAALCPSVLLGDARGCLEVTTLLSRQRCCFISLCFGHCFMVE